MLRHRRHLVRAALAAPLAVLAVAVAPSAASAPTSFAVGGDPAPAPASVPLGSLAAATPLQLTIVLQPRDPAGLTALATAVSTPGSPDYHDYLTTDEFAQQFGASAADVAAVEAAMRADGLAPGPVAADGLSLSVSGDAAQASHAFSVGLERYREPGGRDVYANTAAARVPAALHGDVADVLGLSDVPVAAPVSVERDASPRRSQVVRGDDSPQPQAQPGPCMPASQTASSEGAYTINQIADAYGLGPLYGDGDGDTGAGVTVALYELQPFSTNDVATYQQCFGTNANVEVEGSSSSPVEAEAALDIENVIGLAPGATIEVFEGDNGGGGPYATLQDTVNSGAQVVSDSWGMCEPQQDPSLMQEENTLFEQAATQGETVLAAAGDSGSQGCTSGPDESDLAVDDAASQPYVTGVGGTTLSSPGTPPAESVWNTYQQPGISDHGASGGGISTQWPMPTYQSSAVPGVINSYSSGTPCGLSAGSYCREVPDVSADANPQTGYAIYYGGGWEVYGGTSAAAPFWAGMIALADASGLGNCSPTTPLGFLNQTLYSIAAGPAYADAFNDITSGDNNPSGSGAYPATPGYDMATGLGTPIATDGASAGLVDQLCSAPPGSGVPPAVTGLSARDAVPGSSLSIDGSGFFAGATVHFGTVAATGVTVTDSGQITVTVPPGSGTVDVTVTTAAGTSATSAADQFTYGPTATIVAPASGAAYTKGQKVLVSYSCAASAGVSTCDGTAAAGAALDTSATGSSQFTVTATDANGVSVTETSTYTVVAPPRVSLTRPANGAVYYRGEKVHAAFGCTATAPVTVASCGGSVASGRRLRTSTAGQWYFTVRATDSNGVSVARTASYDVVAARPTVSELRETAPRWVERRSRRRQLPLGTTFSFWVDQHATVTLSFTRLAPGRHDGQRCGANSRHGRRACTRTVPPVTIAVKASAGHARVRFSGRTSHGLLAPGLYVATVVATGRSGKPSAAVGVAFRIAPG